jgi:hypothetical protein
MQMTSTETDTQGLEDRVKALQRAVYYLIWRRSGFGEHCIHCNHVYPGHEAKCKAAEVEELIR